MEHPQLDNQAPGYRVAGRRIPRHLLVPGAVADSGGPGGNTWTSTAGSGRRVTLVLLVIKGCLQSPSRAPCSTSSTSTRAGVASIN